VDIEFASTSTVRNRRKRRKQVSSVVQARRVGRT
jgi:hypothetical protein